MSPEAICHRIGYLGAFVEIPEPYSYTAPREWPEAWRKAWRRGKSQAAVEAQEAACGLTDDAYTNPYQEGSFAHRVFHDHCHHLWSEQSERRLAAERRAACWDGFHSAETIQELKEWFMEFHPNFVETPEGSE